MRPAPRCPWWAWWCGVVLVFVLAAWGFWVVLDLLEDWRMPFDPVHAPLRAPAPDPNARPH